MSAISQGNRNNDLWVIERFSGSALDALEFKTQELSMPTALSMDTVEYLHWGYVRFVFITSLANAFYVRTLRTDLVWQDCEYGTASKVSAVPLHISKLAAEWNFIGLLP